MFILLSTPTGFYLSAITATSPPRTRRMRLDNRCGDSSARANRMDSRRDHGIGATVSSIFSFRLLLLDRLASLAFQQGLDTFYIRRPGSPMKCHHRRHSSRLPYSHARRLQAEGSTGDMRTADIAVAHE